MDGLPRASVPATGGQEFVATHSPWYGRLQSKDWTDARRLISRSRPSVCPPPNPDSVPALGGAQMSGSLTRRKLVGSSAAVAAGAAIPSVAWPERSSASGSRKVDVVVVGAGLSGLAAARRLA